MKIIDGNALVDKIKKEADKIKDSGWYMIVGLVLGLVNDEPEAEAYTEARNRIENMAEVIEDMAGIIEDQQERIDIMAADMSEWISVNERMPEQRLGVLVYCPEYNNIYIGNLDDFLQENKWYYFGCHGVPIEDEVTHWKPIPKPPKDGDKQ